MNAQQKILTFLLFIVVYCLPHYNNYNSKGIVFTGDIWLKKSQNINNLNSLISFSREFYLDALNLFENGIILFFISALIFQYIIKFFK